MRYAFNGIELDDEIFALRRGDADVPIRPQALDVLLYLIRHRERVVTKRELYEAIWGGAAVTDNTLPQAITAVRRAVGDDGDEPSVVQTIRGRGYRFIAELSASPEARAGAPVESFAFVGREDVIELFDELRRRAQVGRATLLVCGGAGVGKSRLLGELAARARAAGARTLEARCHGGTGVPPLWPWTQALRSYAEGPKAPLADEARALADQLAACGGGSEPAGALAFDRVAQWLRRAAQQELAVVLLDDVHHADAGSVILLKLLTAALAGAKALFVLAYRDAPVSKDPVLGRTLGALARDDRARRVALEALSRDEARRLAESALGRPPEDALVDRLVEKTDNNPLLLCQTLRAMRATQALDGSRDGSTSALLATSDLREAVELHLEDLSEPAQRMLAAASVLGAELTLALLAATVGVDPARLLEPLEEALRWRVLVKTPAGAYRFAHVLVRDALYRKLPAARRVALHEAAGAAARAQGGAEEAVCHYERALQGLDLLASAGGGRPPRAPPPRPPPAAPAGPPGGGGPPPPPGAAPPPPGARGGARRALAGSMRSIPTTSRRRATRPPCGMAPGARSAARPKPVPPEALERLSGRRSRAARPCSSRTRRGPSRGAPSADRTPAARSANPARSR